MESTGGGYPDIWLIYEWRDADIFPVIKLESCDLSEPGFISCVSRIVQKPQSPYSR